MNNPNQNYNCDNYYCLFPEGEIKVLPTGGSSNALLCHSCYLTEIAFRKVLNKKLSKESQWDLPRWEDLKVYNPGE